MHSVKWQHFPQDRPVFSCSTKKLQSWEIFCTVGFHVWAELNDSNWFGLKKVFTQNIGAQPCFFSVFK